MVILLFFWGALQIYVIFNINLANPEIKALTFDKSALSLLSERSKTQKQFSILRVLFSVSDNSCLLFDK